jgi:hypothetical protein
VVNERLLSFGGRFPFVVGPDVTSNALSCDPMEWSICRSDERPAAASSKATFKASRCGLKRGLGRHSRTSINWAALLRAKQPAKAESGIRQLPNVIAGGGGMVVRAK